MHIENAHQLQAPLVRVTAGQRHPEVSDHQGIRWVVDSIMELQGFASKFHIRIAIENHLRDDYAWKMPDFAAETDVFLKMYEELSDTPITINYNCATPVAQGEDPIIVRRRVPGDVAPVRAGDWSKAKGGIVTAGEGDVPFDDIFRELAANEFSGYVSVMNGPGQSEDDVRRSMEFLQGKIEQYFLE